MAANGNIITSCDPSLEKGRRHEEGLSVPEMGTNLLEAIGTHAIRTPIGWVATLNPTFRGRSLQPALDLLVTAGNIASARARRAIKDDPNAKPCSPTETEVASSRVRLMRAAQIGSYVVAALTALQVRQEDFHPQREEWHPVDQDA